jgi:hypothetical protein
MIVPPHSDSSEDAAVALDMKVCIATLLKLRNGMLSTRIFALAQIIF